MNILGRVTWIQLLTFVAFAGLLSAIAVPSHLAGRRKAAVREAAGDLEKVFQSCRTRAMSARNAAGVKFTDAAGEWAYTVYDDGNGDGINDQDIVTHADRQAFPPARVLAPARGAHIGLPRYPIIDPDGEVLIPSRSPVQFGGSTVSSFSRDGSSSWGSIYLTDRYGDAWVLRLCGATGRCALLRYDAETRSWEEQW
jgi:type II secretory pathway pseudopilin PulG